MISITIKVPQIKSNLAWYMRTSLMQSWMIVRRTATQKAPYKTGNLRRSITDFATSNSIEIWSRLEYAPIHEFWWVITPKNAKALVFKVWWKFVRVKKVVIPKRPYLLPALQENKDEIIKIFTRNLEKYI